MKSVKSCLVTFCDTAKNVNFSQVTMLEIIDEIKDALPKVMLQVSATLHEGFPIHILNSSFEHTQKIVQNT